jgi:hypothetical protein
VRTFSARPLPQSAAETEAGKRWSESRIKELTGGDKITARFMRQDFFDFIPQFKLLFSGNHMPVLRTVNKAIGSSILAKNACASINGKCVLMRPAHQPPPPWRVRNRRALACVRTRAYRRFDGSEGGCTMASPIITASAIIASVGVLALATAYAENLPPNLRSVPPPESWPAPPPPPKPRIWPTGTNVVITGEIEANDYAVFVDTVLPETKTVYLNSPGGHLAPALKIAIMVKERDYETVVENYGVCASACAVIWLSGNLRRMLPGSRIGLHSARAKEDPTLTRSDFGTTQMTRTYLKIADCCRSDINVE